MAIKDTIPATLRYAIEVYDAMEQEAQDEVVEGEEVRIWRGKFSRVVTNVISSNGYYGKVKKLLIDNGHVEILSQGSRGNESVIRLVAPPSTASEIPSATLTRAQEYGRLTRSVEALQAWRETFGGLNVAEVLINYEQRLNKLEQLLLVKE